MKNIRRLSWKWTISAQYFLCNIPLETHTWLIKVKLLHHIDPSLKTLFIGSCISRIWIYDTRCDPFFFSFSIKKKIYWNESGVRKSPSCWTLLARSCLVRCCWKLRQKKAVGSRSGAGGVAGGSSPSTVGVGAAAAAAPGFGAAGDDAGGAGDSACVLKCARKLHASANALPHWPHVCGFLPADHWMANSIDQRWNNYVVHTIHLFHCFFFKSISSSSIDIYQSLSSQSWQ